MFRTIVAALVVLFAQSGYADQAFMQGKIESVLIDEKSFGVCMIKMDANVSRITGLDCPSNWVSVSCSGDFTAKDVAYRMFDLAQMAMALEQTVNVRIDDDRKHNSFCIATRLEVVKEE